MFEILEHTADIGFRARAATLEELFAESGRALVSLVVDLEGLRADSARRISAHGEDLESLLVNWLNEVLYALDGEHIALFDYRSLEIKDGRVAAEASGEKLQAERHPVKLIVKGVTYHQLRVRQDGGEWNAEVYLDI